MNIHFIKNLREKHSCTVVACCISYITQSVAVSFPPLLFLTFNKIYGIPMSKVTLLVTISFSVQLVTDLFAAKFADRIGRRQCMVFAHVISAFGFIGLGLFPDLFPSSFAGIVSACVLYSCGCGMIEVIAAPVISEYGKAVNGCLLSLLQSFFCWGTVFVIVLSTIFFSIFGTEKHQIQACLWAIIPTINIFLFCIVPLPQTNAEKKSSDFSITVKNPLFLALAAVMLCGGAAEHSISQWASAFAESCLNIPKAIGDILGPCLFAILMGTARVLHSKISDKIELTKYMFFCGIICSISFLMTAFTRVPLISFTGCALCGFSCGVFWPGTFGLAAEKFTSGDTTLFALLAFAGDFGSTLGPSIVGFTASFIGNNLSPGIIFSTIFPLFFTALIYMLRKGKRLSDNH